MKNFKLHFKVNGVWQEISRTNNEYSGIPVFPFTYGEMLDERLNEAYVNIRKCKVSNFSPNTEMKIEVIENAGTENATTTSFCFIVARDNAIERPIGSGLYRHEIYLIERTKKLEGIICQSITFTNPKGNVYTDAARDLPPDITTTPSGTANFNNFYIQQYQSVIPPGKVFDTVSTKDIFQLLKENLRGGDSYDISYDYSHVIVTKDGNQTDYRETYDTYDQVYEITANANQINIEYIIAATYFGSGMTGDDITIMVKFAIGVASNRYPLRPYTIADCIDRCLLLAEPLFGDEQPRYRLDPAQREKYEKIYAPYFSMTQCTLREQLKVIGGYIHAEPRLTEDDLIHFDELGEGEEWTPSEPYVYNQKSQDINEYCTQVDTSASNIINSMDYAQGVIYSPNRSDVLTIRTESTYARVNEENGFAYTQFPIYDVVKVESGIFDQNRNGMYIPPTDITPYIFEATEYNANLQSNFGEYPKSKAYALYFSRGQNNIYGLFYKETNIFTQNFERYSIVKILSKVTGISETDIRDKLGGEGVTYAGNLFFRISYIPYYSTRFSHGKPYLDGIKDDFSKIYNQSENLIETRYYGENIKGAAARLGNVEQTRTYRFSSLASVPRVGQTLVGYSISAVNVSVLPVENMGIKITVALSKDFNRISQYVGIQSRKRTYEVSEAEAYQRNILLREYCVVGKKVDYQKGIFRDIRAINSIFTQVNMLPYSAVSAYRTGSTDDKQGEVMLPIVSSSFGNVMTFSWSYKDNYSAGDRVSWETSSNNVSGFFQNDVPYCDHYGRIEKYHFRIMESPLSAVDKTIAQSLPSREYIPGIADLSVSTDPVGGYQMQKDSREVINITASLEFKTNLESIIIGSALPANSGAVRNKFDENGGFLERFEPRLYYLSSKVGKFQMTITDDLSNGETLVVSGSDGTVYVEIPPQYQNATAWAICLPRQTDTKIYDNDGQPVSVDETTGGDVLIACNDPLKFWEEADPGENNTRRIYLNLARTIYN